ncbi:MAG: orotate phosphoribosyltransferase [Bacteroidales bacterium]
MKTQSEIARLLLQSKAIKLEPANPFTWASGWKSPIYCDNRKTLSYPDVRDTIRNKFVDLIKAKFGVPDVIAGVATGAIAQAALVADNMGLPMVYIRSSAKSHGLENLIEGVLEPGQKTVVIEDLVSTGGSSLKAVDALRQAGAEVLGMTAIFTYGFPVAEENFKNHKCVLHTLSNYEYLLDTALEAGAISNKELEILKNWRKDPRNWGK